MNTEELRALKRADRERQNSIHLPGGDLPIVVFAVIGLFVLGTAATFLILSALGVVHR